MDFSFIDDPEWKKLDGGTQKKVIDSAFHRDIMSDPQWGGLDSNSQESARTRYSQKANDYSKSRLVKPTVAGNAPTSRDYFTGVQDKDDPVFSQILKSNPNQDPEVLREGYSAIQEKFKNKEGGWYGKPIKIKELENLGRDRIKELEKSGTATGAFLRTMSRVPENLLASGIMAVQGQGGASAVNKGIGDRFVDWVQKRNTDLANEYEKTGDFIPGVISEKDIAELGPNLAFGGVSMAGTAAGMASASLVPVPGARIAGGIAGGAIAAKRMDSYQVLGSWLDQKNQQSIQNTGKPITIEDEEKFKKEFDALADEHGLWEAGPEAIGNMLELGIALSPLKNVTRLLPKGTIGKLIKGAIRVASLIGVEGGTETITQMGQTNTEVEAGMSDSPVRDWESIEDWLTSAKEVLPQVLLLSGFMGAGGAVYRKATGKSQQDIEIDVSDKIQEASDEELSQMEQMLSANGDDPSTGKVLGIIQSERKKRAGTETKYHQSVENSVPDASPEHKEILSQVMAGIESNEADEDSDFTESDLGKGEGYNPEGGPQILEVGGGSYIKQDGKWFDPSGTEVPYSKLRKMVDDERAQVEQEIEAEKASVKPEHKEILSKVMEGFGLSQDTQNIPPVGEWEFGEVADPDIDIGKAVKKESEQKKLEEIGKNIGSKIKESTNEELIRSQLQYKHEGRKDLVSLIDGELKSRYLSDTKQSKSKVTTLGGAIREMGGLNAAGMKSDILDRNKSAGNAKIFNTGGVEIEKAKDALVKDGWMLPSEDLGEILSQDPEALKRGRFGEDSKTKAQKKSAMDLEQSETAPDEMPPDYDKEGAYKEVYAGDLTEGTTATMVIDGKYDKYKVVENDPFGDGVTLQDGERLTIPAGKEVEVLQADIKKSGKTASAKGRVPESAEIPQKEPATLPKSRLEKFADEAVESSSGRFDDNVVTIAKREKLTQEEFQEVLKLATNKTNEIKATEEAAMTPEQRAERAAGAASSNISGAIERGETRGRMERNQDGTEEVVEEGLDYETAIDLVDHLILLNGKGRLTSEVLGTNRLSSFVGTGELHMLKKSLKAGEIGMTLEQIKTKLEKSQSESIPAKPKKPEAPKGKEAWETKTGQLKYEDIESTPYEDVLKKMPAWRMSKKEYISIPRKKGLGIQKRDGSLWAHKHRQAIEQAVKDGKTIPAEVLKDYPDLTKQAKPKTGKQKLKAAAVKAKEPWSIFAIEALEYRAKEIKRLQQKVVSARKENQEEVAQIYEGQIKDYQGVDEQLFRDDVKANLDYYQKSNVDPFLRFKNKEMNRAGIAKPKEAAKPKETKEPWDYLDTTHPDAIYPYGEQFRGGENLSAEQIKEYHNVWIDRINKELKFARGTETNIHGIKWANKAEQGRKTQQVKKLIKQRRTHEKALKEIKKAERYKVARTKETKKAKGTPKYSVSNPQTKTKAFLRWFGKSKVVDENGAPLVCYHGAGTHKEIAVFDSKKSYLLKGSIWFTPSKQYANQYALRGLKKANSTGGPVGAKKGHVVPVYLSVKNPLYAKSSAFKKVQSEYKESGTGKTFAEFIVFKGHDAFISFEKKGVPLHKVSEIAVFSPTQIKSATGNQGTFDQNNPDIRYSTKPGDSNLTRKDLKKIFHWADSARTLKDGSIVITKGPRQFKINQVNHIAIDRASFELGYRRKPTLEELTQGARGAYQDGVITLSNIADAGTVAHESWHYLKSSGLISKMDVAALRNKLGNKNATEEQEAEWVEKNVLNRDQKGRLGKLIQKVFDFVDSLINLVHRTARGVVRDIESGKAFTEKQSSPVGKTLVPAYQKLADRWYSQMEQSLEKKLPGRGTPEQLSQMVQGWAKKGEFKADELSWSGLNDWLAEQTGKVTKADVMKYLAENRLGVQEVVKGGLGFEGRSARMDELITRENAGTLTLEEDRELDQLEREVNNGFETANDTKFSQYQEPGGENYKELLITLPERGPKLPETTGDYAQMLFNKSFDELREDQVDKVVAQMRVDDNSLKRKNRYKGPHYEEPNILAHVRFNERTDADGNRVLFLEEIQSDQAQDYRKQLKNIEKVVANDFKSVVRSMVKAGVLKEDC